jgi:heme exporter protein D
MVPMSFLTIVMTAVYQFYGWPAWSLTAMSTTGLILVGYVIYKKMTAPSRLVAETRTRQAALEAQRRATAAGGGD